MKPIKNGTVATVCVLILAGVFAAALVVTARHSHPGQPKSATEYHAVERRDTPEQSLPAAPPEDTTVSPPPAQTPVAEPILPAAVKPGWYTCGGATVCIHSCQDGYLEATLSDGTATMEFAGQLVGNGLVATETDSLGNTVEVQLTAEDDRLILQTALILPVEDNAPFLLVYGTFQPE